MDPIILDLVKNHFPMIREPELQEEIAEHGRYMEVEANSTLMDIGDTIRVMPMLVKGSLKVLREDEEGNELLMYYIASGQTCAMSLTCCMAHKKSAIRAVTEEPCEFIMIPTQYIDDWMRKYTGWKDFVMQTYQLRFEELLHTIDSIAFKNMDERLLAYLQEKSRVAGEQTLQMTHQDIADELNSSREVISRLLKQMEKEGHVELGRNKIALV
jgi:CRP/FNR family transcriptional regulator